MNKFLLHSSRLVSASVITDNLSLVEVISVLNKSKFEVTPYHQRENVGAYGKRVNDIP